MRIPNYLSPSAIFCWQDDREEYYRRYLSDNKKPRFPQNEPMAIGSSFDAIVKSYLYTRFYGNDCDGLYDKRQLFEKQVEENLWESAWKDGNKIFDAYKSCGALADLILEISRAIGEPHFEFDLHDEIDGIPMLGKPDCFFISETGTKVIVDFKVNGCAATRLKSPGKGYIKLREQGKIDKVHRDCAIVNHCGVTINAAVYLEEVDKKWGRQLSAYSWLLGEPVGSENWIASIDQICGPMSRLRFATHRCRVSSAFNSQFFAVAKDLWEIVKSKWIFRDMSESDSAKLCSLLDEMGDGEGEYGF